MTTATAERRAAAGGRDAIFVGLPERGEIGREAILEALRRAGQRVDQRRREAAAALSADRPARDRMRFDNF